MAGLWGGFFVFSQSLDSFGMCKLSFCSKNIFQLISFVNSIKGFVCIFNKALGTLLLINREYRTENLIALWSLYFVFVRVCCVPLKWEKIPFISYGLSGFYNQVFKRIVRLLILLLNRTICHLQEMNHFSFSMLVIPAVL